MTHQVSTSLTGVFAALPTPFGPDGNVLLDNLDRLLDFLLDRGVKGVCVGGATGEYAACSVEQRVEIYNRVARRVSGRAQMICGVGGEHRGQVRTLARAAADCGAVAALFPTPGFLPYRQEDLVDVLAQVSADLPLPVLLYHIPQCTRDAGFANILKLAGAIPNIVGFKDSSGIKANFTEIRAAQALKPMVFLIGRDELLAEAFENGSVGTISGVASACPELVVPICEAAHAGQHDQAHALQKQLDEFISQIVELPTSWAIKLALQIRGIEIGAMSWPMGPRLQHKAEEFQQWFAGHVPKFQAVTAAPALPGA